MQEQEINFKETKNQSQLEKAADIFILIGAIFATIIQAIFILLSVFLLFIWLIPGAAIISLVWVIKHMVKNNQSIGWVIGGLILGFFTGEIFTLIGYICKLIANSENK